MGLKATISVYQKFLLTFKLYRVQSVVYVALYCVHSVMYVALYCVQSVVYVALYCVQIVYAALFLGDNQK